MQTEEYMDTFDFEMAGLFCQRALDVESDNLQALDMLGHICSELGDVQKAKEISFQLDNRLLLSLADRQSALMLFSWAC